MLLGFFSLLIGQFFANSVVPIGTKLSTHFTGPVLFVFFRFLIGSIILFFIFIFTRQKFVSRKELKDFAALGFLIMINVLGFTIAISYTTIIMSTLIFSITPALVGIGAHFLLKEKITRQKILGLFVCFVGLLFLISQSITVHEQNVFGEPIGNILMLIPMVGYAMYIIYSRKVLHTKNQLPVVTTLFTFTFSTLFVGVIALSQLLSGKITIHPLPSAGLQGIIIVGIGSVIQYLFLQIGIKRTDAFTASLFQYTGPFIAASISIPLLHEEINFQLLIGGFLILLGVFIATTYEQLKKKQFNNS
jgi:drug/metabolite transporter (DMT)-like permease